MVDFIEIESTETFKVTFLDPTTGQPIDVNNPVVQIGYFDGGSFITTFPQTAMVKVAGKVGEYVKQVYLDPLVYAANQFFYVRYYGTDPIISNQLFFEDTFRTLESSAEKNTQALFLQNSQISGRSCTPNSEFFISANSEITRRTAFVTGEMLGECDLWIELLDSQTQELKDAYQVTYDIEDLTDCYRICTSECGGILVANEYMAVNFDLGKYYADWIIPGDANPGPYMIHWDIMYTPHSQPTRISQGFHIVKKKNAYDLNFQEPYAPWSPTAGN